jgi:protein SCO1
MGQLQNPDLGSSTLNQPRPLTLWIAASGLLIVSVGALAWTTTPAARPAASDALGLEPSASESGKTLVDHHSQPFSFDSLRGKTVLLNFVFTHCPTVCPTQTKALMRVMEMLPGDVRERTHVVSVSIDPERDTPEVLRDFATKLSVDLDHWTFVTGAKTAIANINRAYSAQALPEGALPLDHRTEVRLIDASGKLMQTYTGRPLDEPRLAREVQTVDHMFSQRGR